MRDQVADDMLICFRRSHYVRAMEKGKHLPFQQLEVENQQVLEAMQKAVDACEKNWPKLYHQTVDFHTKNALSWANAAVGEDLTHQIDPDYSLVAHIRQQYPVLVP